MAIDLHCLMASPPARAVLIVARRLGVPINIVNVDMMNGEHLTEEYSKINPRKTVPAINDNGYFLGESRAVMMYLCNQYGDTDANNLYPKDAKKRGLVDRALFLSAELYETGKLNILRPLVYEGRQVTDANYTHFYHLLKSVDELIGSNKYLATETLTIADVSLFVDLCYLRDVACIKMDDYKNVTKWMTLMRQEINEYEELIETPQKEWMKTLEQIFKWKLPWTTTT